MVSKVFSGHSFYHACRYVVNKPGATVLECEGVRGHDFKVMSDDFIMQQQLRPQKEKACFHCSLSFYPGEKLSDELMVKIAKEYLGKMKITDTQFTITKHTDRKHIHMHVVANMVDNKGEAISDSFLGLRGKKTAQQLTQQYHLVPAIGKHLEQTNYEALHKSEANKYKVYSAIIQALPQCKTMEDLEKKLQLQGIEMQYKYKGQTLEKQGISFKIGENTFKGSKVDRQFSLGNLEKTLVNNQGQGLDTKRDVREDLGAKPIKHADENYDSSQSKVESLLPSGLTRGIEKLVETLIMRGDNYEQSSYELLKENKRKRKKQSRSERGGLH
ncbi:MAG: hypothetical protein JWQ09_1922 [Segetibacter sp.]|nr:hypothetical protein [Segetibacter sp.]